MQIKNTIPAEFISNSALLKNIEHMVQTQTESEAVSHEILADLYMQTLHVLRGKNHH